MVTRCQCVSHENIHHLLMGIITETRIVSSNLLSNALYMPRKRQNPYKPKPSFQLGFPFFVKMELEFSARSLI